MESISTNSASSAPYARALDTDQAATYTGLAVKTLEGFRHKGGGPKFIRYSRRAIRYRLEDLDDWMRSKLVASTSEAA